MLAEGIEGFKEEKVDKYDTDYLQFMERPEETCTVLRTKRDFVMQHWYYCYTCGLTGNKGCCSVCVRRCHKGH